jgi:hypothetical protein
MSEILSSFKRKIGSIAFTSLTTGIVLVLLAVIVIWVPIVGQVVIAFFILVVAFGFSYLGIKLYGLMKDIDKFLK